MLWIILGVVALLVVALVLFYNRLVRLRNRVENAWAQVDVQLKRRYDLIPNLVETVKGYASHERETFEAVTNARAAAQSATGPAEQGAAEGLLSAALGRLIAVAEAYPELQADENFRQLQEELAQTENRIAVSRQVYNDTVLTYNTAIQTVPGVFFAGPLGLLEARLLRGRGRGPGGTTRRVLAVAVLAALALAGDAAAKSFALPAADVTIQVARDGSLLVDEVIIFQFDGSFTRRVPRGSAPRGRVARPGGGLGGRAGVQPRRVRGAPVLGPARNVRHDADGQGRANRVALPGAVGAAALPDPLPPARVGDGLRRRRRRERQGLGRRVGGPARPAHRDAGRAGRHRPRLGPSGRRARRRDARRPARQPAGARHSVRPVRRAAHAHSAAGLHLDRGNESGERAGPREDRGRGAGGRSVVRARPAQDRRGARQPAANARAPARARARTRPRRGRRRLVVLRPRARDVLRPGVRTGAADGNPGGARAGSPRTGRHAGVARVHGDAVRPDPAWPLSRRAGDDRAEDLGRVEDAAGRGPRVVARRHQVSRGGL